MEYSVMRNPSIRKAGKVGVGVVGLGLRMRDRRIVVPHLSFENGVLYHTGPV